MVKIAKPFITQADESPAYWQLGLLWQVMATGVQTDNCIAFLDQILPDEGIGSGPVTHTHTQYEGLYVLSGKCTFNAGGVHGISGTPGTFISIPRLCEHSFTVDEPNTHLLNFYLPAGFEQLLIGVARPAEERKLPPRERLIEMLPPKWLAEKLSEDYGEDSVLGNPFTDAPDPSKRITRPTPGATVFPFTSRAADRKSYHFQGACWSVLGSSVELGNQYTLFEVKFGHGVVIPLRRYRERHEIIYILEGDLEAWMDGKIIRASSGSLVFIPGGTMFSLRTVSINAHCLDIHTGTGFDTMMISMAREVNEFLPPTAMDLGSPVGNLFENIGLSYMNFDPAWS